LLKVLIEVFIRYCTFTYFELLSFRKIMYIVYTHLISKSKSTNRCVQTILRFVYTCCNKLVSLKIENILKLKADVQYLLTETKCSFKSKSMPAWYSYRQNSLLVMQASNFLKMCRIMIISVDFLEFHPISVMFSGYSNSTSMGMQLRAENRDSIDRKALDYDQNV